MRILVTGGCGFIGSNFIRYWLSKYPNDLITNLDKLTYAGHLSSTLDFSKNPRYKFVKGDINSHELVDKLTKNIDLILHFAAESHVDRSISDPEEFLTTNVKGTFTLLNYAIKNEVKRFHHVSTDEVYGSLPLNSQKKFAEKTSYDPHSPYSASKASSDHFVRAYHDTYGLFVTISNCSNNYGPYQDPEKYIPRMITNLITGKKVPIYGDGKNVRDWLYVEDHCRAIDIIVHKGEKGESYVVGGTTNDIDNLTIAKKIIRIMSFKDDMIEFVDDRPGHDRRYAVDWTKIHRKLGWKPEKDFNAWLIETVKWYKENEDWWRPLKIKAERYYDKSK